jgi:hypothetical protein
MANEVKGLVGHLCPRMSVDTRQVLLHPPSPVAIDGLPRLVGGAWALCQDEMGEMPSSSGSDSGLRLP